jgi:hypothetical protein
MLQAILRWAIPLLALFVLGPLALLLTASLRAIDGSGEASLLVGRSPTQGLLMGVGAILIALVVGVVGARLLGARRGLFSAGLVLAWAAWGTGHVDKVLGQTNSSQTLWMFAAEAALLTLLGGACAWVILKIKPKPITFNAQAPIEIRPEPSSLLDSSALPAIGASLLAAALVAWLLAFDTQKGQTIGAAIIAAMIGTMVARMVSQSVSPALFVAAVGVLGIVGPAAATFIHPSASGPARAALAGTLFALARPMPFDWLAGAMIGVPLGLAWAGSLVEKQEKPK